jgi:hypothetical protein
VRTIDDIGLPAPVLEAARLGSDEKIEAGALRCTELTDSPRIAQLRRLHWDQLESPISGQIWAFVGSAIHLAIEVAGKHKGSQQYVSEQRLYTKVGDTTITGKIDLQLLGNRRSALTDIKFTSAFGAYLRLPSWEKQLNVYAFLHWRTMGYDPSALIVIALYRDWSSWEAKQKPEYPKAAIQKHSLTLWPLEQREAYIKERIELHLDAWAGAEMGELPLCTPEERWMDQKFHVRSRHAERPRRICQTELEAHEYIAKQKTSAGLYVIQTAPNPRRCKGNWCGVAKFCTQFQNELNEGKTDGTNPHDGSDAVSNFG